MYIIIFYLIGIAPSYLLCKKSFTDEGFNWTKSNRRFALFMGVLSWAGVFSCFIVKFIGTKDDSPAKW